MRSFTVIKNINNILMFCSGYQVAVSVNIYLSSLGGGKDVLSECGSTINETLNDPTMLAQSDFLEKIRYLEGKTDNDTLCVAAILSPHHFYYERVVWICEANYTYVEDTWHCVPDGGTLLSGLNIYFTVVDPGGTRGRAFLLIP